MFFCVCVKYIHNPCTVMMYINLIKLNSGADFTKGLSFWLSQGLKSKTLVLARSGT